MSEMLQQLFKIVQNGEMAINNIVDIDSEMNMIYKMFPLMSINEKKEAIKRYEYLGSSKLVWYNQIDLVKEFLTNTANDLSSLKNNWFENKMEINKLKKLYKMLENEFQFDDDSKVDAIIPEMTESDREILKKDIESIQEEKKIKQKQQEQE